MPKKRPKKSQKIICTNVHTRNTTLHTIITMVRVAILLVFAFISVAYGGWLFTSACGHPELGGFAVNGNCVPLDNKNEYYKKIECRGNTAVESTCWDPLCGNCEERDKIKLNECNKGLSVSCFEDDIVYSKIVGKSYALVGTFADANCTSAIREESAFPTNKCIQVPERGSMLFNCTSNNSLMVYLYSDFSCISRMDDYVVPLNKCSIFQYALCYGN